MKKKRITQLFPFLLTVRGKQRKIIFYAKMRFDQNRYARTIVTKFLPFCAYKTKSKLLNENTGRDMIYQENKVFNLKLAAKTLNGILIKPGETFSFWQAVRCADRKISYKDGLAVINGKLTTTRGGGLCQMSNLIFEVFLHSPLDIVERHTHKIRRFPSALMDRPEGIDATVSEGLLDLKVKNKTDETFQLGIGFDEENIIGSLHTEKEITCAYEIEGRNLSYFRRDGKIFEKISIYRRQINPGANQTISEGPLYDNLCEIGYRLPDDTPITGNGD